MGRMAARYLAAASVVLLAGAVQAHDIITTPITWSREISRVVYAKCASCHHEGGSAFSLMTYADARPWAVAIKEEILRRNMPPWGAVKGFGDFRNDQAMTPEEMELIVNWTEGGVPEGEVKDLPEKLPEFGGAAETARDGEIVAQGDFQLTSAFMLDGLMPRQVPEKATFQITAEFPDGHIEPLVWLNNYSPKFAHPFLMQRPLALPKGTVIHGIPAGASVALWPVAADAGE